MRRRRKKLKVNPTKYNIHVTILNWSPPGAEDSKEPPQSLKEPTKIDWNSVLEKTSYGWRLVKDKMGDDFREITLFRPIDRLDDKAVLGYDPHATKSMIIQEFSFRVRRDYTEEELVEKLERLQRIRDQLEYCGMTEIKYSHQKTYKTRREEKIDEREQQQ